MKKTDVSYLIAFLIMGQEGQHHRMLSSDVSRIFGVADVAKRIPPHITLKHMGAVQNPAYIQDLEKVLGDFCQSEKQFYISIAGIENFGEDAVVANVVPSEELVAFYHRLYHELVSFSWMPARQFEGANMHFHTTLAADTRGKAANILPYLADRNPHYKLCFDNVALLKKVSPRCWKTCRRYGLK